MHADAKGQLSHVTSKSHTKAKQTTCSLYELYPMVKVLLNWPSTIICQVFYSHLHTVKSGCDYKELISSPWWDSPRSVQWAPGLWKNHTWWELWNNAVSGMFPRWPAGSDGGLSGWLVGFMGNVTHAYRVTWSNVSCVSLHLDLLLCWIKTVLCVCTGFI